MSRGVYVIHRRSKENNIDLDVNSLIQGNADRGNIHVIVLGLPDCSPSTIAMPLHNVLRQGTHALTGSINSYRILIYCIVSAIAVSAVILNALKNHANFYSIAIYLSKSNRSVLVRLLTFMSCNFLKSTGFQVLANFGFLLALLCGHVVQRIFFGTLRPNEIEVSASTHLVTDVF